jgi:4-amino-4-deoxy-L-arabinose transferase-like glycosyltransferase
MTSRLNTPAKKLAIILASLLGLRLVILFIAPWGLHGDEAQYWAWSQAPDFGYFSKPPMIAWVIGLTTSIFGNAEWAVRLSAPFLHIGTATMIFFAGRKLFNPDAGFWAALIYILMPAVWLSSYIMSTDAVLLFFWAVALHAWACLRAIEPQTAPKWGRALQLGLALGCGLLSKYAMAFFLPILILAIFFDKPSRKALLNLNGLIVAALVILLLAPNMMWNAAHEFATISHTGENANLGQDFFHPTELLSFWIDQFGVFGFVPFPMLLVALVAGFRQKLSSSALWIAALAALPLCAISLQALLSRANANWAVTAYVAASLLVAVWALQKPRRTTWLRWGLIVQTAFAMGLSGLAVSPRILDAAGFNNPVKRLRAWPETAEAVRQRANEDAYAFIAVDNRLMFYDLNYYEVFPKRWRMTVKLQRPPPELAMWSLNASPAHHANLTRALPDTDAPVLLISYHHNFEPYFREDFNDLTPLEPIIIDLGPGKTRKLKVWRAEGYRRTTREDRT